MNKKYLFAILIVLIIGTLAARYGKLKIDHEVALVEGAYYQIEENVFNAVKFRDALIELDVAQHKNPEDPWLYLSLSLAKLVQGYTIGDWYEMKTFNPGSVDQAVQLAQVALQKGPRLSQSYAHLARLLILKTEFKEAWQLLNTAHSLDPESFYPWYFRGILYEKMKSAQKANECLNEALLHAKYGYQKSIVNIHLQKVAAFSGDINQQEKLLLQNIQDNKNNAAYYGNYARFLMNHFRYKEAVQYWEKALAISTYQEALQGLDEAKKMLE